MVHFWGASQSGRNVSRALADAHKLARPPSREHCSANVGAISRPALSKAGGALSRPIFACFTATSGGRVHFLITHRAASVCAARSQPCGADQGVGHRGPEVRSGGRLDFSTEVGAQGFDLDEKWCFGPWGGLAELGQVDLGPLKAASWTTPSGKQHFSSNSQPAASISDPHSG